jgi:probable phosphoglycerate mutase
MMSLAATPFWFLRHGETDWNAQNLSQGNVDIPLNPTGIAQAYRAAERLRNRGIVHIVSSPLSRAQDTARVVANALGLPVHLDEGLREVAFGEKEGHPMGDWFATWVDGEYTPDGAEPFSKLRQRARDSVNRVLANPAPVLIVAHGALFRALRAEMGLLPNIRTPNATPFFCEPASPAWSLTEAS